MNKYEVFFSGSGKKEIIEANTSYESTVLFAKFNKIPEKKRYKIITTLVELDGVPVVHLPLF